jgi:hypothetical protein
MHLRSRNPLTDTPTPGPTHPGYHPSPPARGAPAAGAQWVSLSSACRRAAPPQSSQGCLRLPHPSLLPSLQPAARLLPTRDNLGLLLLARADVLHFLQVQRLLEARLGLPSNRLLAGAVVAVRWPSGPPLRLRQIERAELAPRPADGGGRCSSGGSGGGGVSGGGGGASVFDGDESDAVITMTDGTPMRAGALSEAQPPPAACKELSKLARAGKLGPLTPASTAATLWRARACDHALAAGAAAARRLEAEHAAIEARAAAAAPGDAWLLAALRAEHAAALRTLIFCPALPGDPWLRGVAESLEYAQEDADEALAADEAEWQAHAGESRDSSRGSRAEVPRRSERGARQPSEGGGQPEGRGRASAKATERQRSDGVRQSLGGALHVAEQRRTQEYADARRDQRQQAGAQEEQDWLLRAEEGRRDSQKTW